MTNSGSTPPPAGRPGREAPHEAGELREASGGRLILLWAAAKLAVDFAPSFPDHRTIKARIVSWREMADAHPWITDDVLRRAVHLIRWQHKGGFVPEPATFLDYCHAAHTEVRRETARALPPPPAPAGADDPGQQRAKDAARATLARRGLAAVGGFDGRAGTAPLRARRGLQPLTEAEVAAAHQRRGREG